MSEKKKEKRPPHEKPVKISLPFEEALKGLVNTPPPPKEEKEQEKSDSD